MQETKYENLVDSPQREGAPFPDVEVIFRPDAERIDLPEPKKDFLPSEDLTNLIAERETLRKYSDIFLSMDEVSILLWGTQGIKTTWKNGLTKRTVPSAGSRHPFETVLLVNKVEGVTPGLYQYIASGHQLSLLDASASCNADLTEACLKQSHVRTSAVTFAWAAIATRTIWRYSQRGYRYIHLDAGHVCQNLYLLAEAIGCGVCAIAAFDDDAVNRVIGLDGEEQFVVYLASVGKKN